MNNTNQDKLRDAIEEIFYDYHIRGCKPGDKPTNAVCNERKKMDIDQLLALFEKESKEREKELLKDLTDAWLEKYISPKYHEEKKKHLLWEWDTLFHAVNRLVQRQKLKALEKAVGTVKEGTK